MGPGRVTESVATSTKEMLHTPSHEIVEGSETGHSMPESGSTERGGGRAS